MIKSRSAPWSIRVHITALFLAGVACLPAHAIWEAADGEVFLSLEGEIAADSNILSNSDELSDTIYRVTPGISWERARGRGTISLDANCEIERASEYEAYDSENYNANFPLDVPATTSGRLRGSLTAGYFDGSRISSSQNTRVAETSFNIGANGSYQVSGKVNARLGGLYNDTTSDELADYTNSALNLGLGYNIRPTISTYLDVRFTEGSSGYSETIGSGTDTSGNAILVGVDGEITPKLTGHAGFGYDWSESETGGVVYEYTGPTYDVSLTWSPRERTTVILEASNGIDATSTGGVDYTNIGIDLRQEIGASIVGTAGVNYRNSDFSSESRGSDDVFEATVGATYSFTRNYSIGASYTYTDSDSTLAYVTYDRSEWKLFASARF